MGQGKAWILAVVLGAVFAPCPLAWANLDTSGSAGNCDLSLFPNSAYSANVAPVALVPRTLNDALLEVLGQELYDAGHSARSEEVRHCLACTLGAVVRAELGLPHGCPDHAQFHPFQSQADEEQIIQLPDSPGSATLTLTGLLTIAGLQLARSARHAGLAHLLHVSHLPEWYHADAVQVGHAVPFEFQPTLQPMQSVFGLIVTQPENSATRFYRSEARCRLRSPQYTPLAAAPRGPPRI